MIPAKRLCEAPVTRGPRKGLPATGSSTGYFRHYRAGEAACDECLGAQSQKGVEYHKKYPERRRASRRAWQKRNPGYVRPGQQASRAKYYRENREREKATFERWRQANLEVMAEHERKRRARIKEATVIEFSMEQLAAKMAYWGNRCWVCKGPFEAVDHVKPLGGGGPHMLANLRPICTRHNSKKWKHWPMAKVIQILMPQREDVAA
jgi:5-methylcytosine-specific restriction endonuclease McrA